MQIDNHPTTHTAPPSGAPGEAHQRADVAKLKFLLNCCKRKPYAKPLLLADAGGGTFTTLGGMVRDEELSEP